MFIRIDEFSKRLNRYESLGDSFISLTIFSFHRGMSGIIQHFRGRIAVIRRYDRHGNYIGEIINRGSARHFDFTHVRTNARIDVVYVSLYSERLYEIIRLV